MSEAEDTPVTPKRRFRLGRLLGTLLFLALVSAGVYGASWINARRYFLIVEPTLVRVAKGRMLPVGHEPFVPLDPALRRAYATFDLPGGMKLPRGESVYTDRVELDQALYRILKDAAEFSLSKDDSRTPALTAAYLQRIQSLPGTSVEQQMVVTKLARDSAYVEAKGAVESAKTALESAARLYRESARGGGGRYTDGESQARVVDRALLGLKNPDAVLEAPVTPPPTPTTATPTTTATTGSEGPPGR